MDAVLGEDRMVLADERAAVDDVLHVEEVVTAEAAEDRAGLAIARLALGVAGIARVDVRDPRAYLRLPIHCEFTLIVMYGSW